MAIDEMPQRGSGRAIESRVRGRETPRKKGLSGKGAREENQASAGSEPNDSSSPSPNYQPPGVGMLSRTAIPLVRPGSEGERPDDRPPGRVPGVDGTFLRVNNYRVQRCLLPLTRDSRSARLPPLPASDRKRGEVSGRAANSFTRSKARSSQGSASR
jgi:hypothetical protein